MRTIFLIGFMGSGKSTVGKVLSKQYNLTFVDVDQYIEKKNNQTIVNIFADGGEALFRRLEHDALKDVVNKAVVSTGGGIVERKENTQMMKENGKIVYLQTSFATVDHRLKNDTTRPLWNNSSMKEKEKLYKKRHSIYKEVADYIVPTDDQTVEDICLEIAHIFSLNRQ